MPYADVAHTSLRGALSSKIEVKIDFFTSILHQ